MRVMSPDRGCLQVDGLSGRRYAARDGVYEMAAGDARALVQLGGFLPSLSGVTRKGIGYVCAGCGFASFFRRCSRCGVTSDRETHASASEEHAHAGEPGSADTGRD